MDPWADLEDLARRKGTEAGGYGEGRVSKSQGCWVFKNKQLFAYFNYLFLLLLGFFPRHFLLIAFFYMFEILKNSHQVENHNG